ncbi:toll-like receptor 13 [Leptopilina heterotoma]|uniref:toll-like receptor 13 n=1 Tax=Leptopilina heterotoma TaxID=63436 RepID=UPI001CA8636A|nr:toll-like receptor 13 [Leptopilina heterotoma]
MNNFLKILIIFLIFRKIRSIDDKSRNPTVCHSTVTTSDFLKFLCYIPSSNNNPTGLIPHYYSIDLKTTSKKLECFGSPNWEEFNIDIRNSFKQPKMLTIKNCYFHQNTVLENIAKSIGAEETEEIYLKMFNDKEIILNDEIFRGFLNLKNLYILNSFKLKNLTDNTLKYFQRLEGVYIYNDSLEELPENIFQTQKNLKVIELAKNSLNIIKPNTFRNLKKLRVINLIRNNIETIDLNALQDLVNLEKLILAENNLKTLPLFDKLEKLRELNVAGNKLENIAEDTFKGLESLRVLNLKNNFFKTFHDSIFHCLTKLEVLNLNSNQLTTISKSLIKIDSLQALKVANNSLTTIENGAFDGAKNLINITLAQNELNFTDANAFQIFSKCPNLKDLNLSFNNFSEFHNEWISMSNNYNLGVLNLSYNFISSFVVPEVFNNDVPLFIDIQYNSITNLVLDLIQNEKFNLKNNVTLDIRKNRIVCDCKFYPLLKHINGELIEPKMNTLNVEVSNLKCYSPRDYRGTLLSDIKIDEFSCDFKKSSEFPSDCDVDCPMKLNIMKNLLTYHCENKRLTKAPAVLCSTPNYQIEMNLNNNYISSYNPLIGPSYENVTNLLLAKNRVTFFSSKILFLHKNIKVIDLSNNLINSINYHDAYIIVTKLNSIKLSRNPLICGMQYYNLRKYQNIIVDYPQMKCTQRADWEKQWIALHLRNKYSICEFPIEKVYEIWGQNCRAPDNRTHLGTLLNRAAVYTYPEQTSKRTLRPGQVQITQWEKFDNYE